MWSHTRRSSCARLAALHVLVMLVAACLGSNVDNEAGPTGQRPLSKVERYENTEPWLLIGGQKRPISLLQSMGHPTSLKLLIEAESEQLLLILQKNEFPEPYSSLSAVSFTSTPSAVRV